ncbi:MAG: hypothetical protein LBJ17_02570 [Dysgonamonadaceae bacterium]|jgi:hypothetical protein|nr:hypothetical protein [Dysgonamonadaceae bacterium]
MTGKLCVWIDDDVHKIREIAQGSFVKLWEKNVRSEIFLYGNAYQGKVDLEMDSSRKSGLARAIPQLLRNSKLCDGKTEHFKSKRYLICKSAEKEPDGLFNNDFLFPVKDEFDKDDADFSKLLDQLKKQLRDYRRKLIMIDLVLFKDDYNSIRNRELGKKLISCCLYHKLIGCEESFGAEVKLYTSYYGNTDIVENWVEIYRNHFSDHPIDKSKIIPWEILVNPNKQDEKNREFDKLLDFFEEG